MSDYNSCQEFRELAILRIENKLSARYQDIGDEYWRSGNYNAAKWSARGGSAAINLLESTHPMPDETVDHYAGRLEEGLRVLKDKFYQDPDDEDGFATGSVGDVISMIKALRHQMVNSVNSVTQIGKYIGHMPDIIAVLEDDERRTEALRDEIMRLFPQLTMSFFDNAPDMVAWLKDNLGNVRLLCLDHDLGPDRQRDGQVFDPGIGRDVVDFLAVQKPSCPVLIHSSNSTAAFGMQFALETAGWVVERVIPIDDLLWVKAQWSGRLETLVNSISVLGESH
ncbi:MAG: hypothetical protein PHF56_12410 [Desulfuromonadaceae bacterium]|nr:hypothetical protein [Desulfuromonadaceae bacterium]